MVQGKLMRFKKLSKKQMGIISATVLVFSCMKLLYLQVPMLRACTMTNLEPEHGN